VGSVFSPYYARARRTLGDALAPAEQHCALNLALYRRAPGSTHYQRFWAMTERPGNQVQRSPCALQIGPSRLDWRADGLHLDVNEWTAPWPRRLRGHVHLQPQVQPGRTFGLDRVGRHQWQPISPVARVAVDFEHPRLRWQGEAYLDCNHGSRPLERDFSDWQWSRSRLSGHRSRVHYDLHDLEGEPRSLALLIDAAGHVHAEKPPPLWALPSTGWGLPRRYRAHDGTPPRLLATLESGPFYSRSLVHSPAVGDEGPLTSVHESLSLARFTAPWVQALLPVRMPRRGGTQG